MGPPCAITSYRATLRPTPLPSALGREEGEEDVARQLLGTPGPLSAPSICVALLRAALNRKATAGASASPF
jgi:hypothetical protein